MHDCIIMHASCGSLLKELNEYLSEEKVHDERKRAMLYKKWKERVFEPIHCELNKKMASDDYKILDNEKRKLFDNYLTYSSKQEVFLETISHKEYSPDNSRQLKVCGTITPPSTHALTCSYTHTHTHTCTCTCAHTHTCTCTHTHSHQVMMSPLNDPLRAQNDDAELESRIIEGCEQGIPLENSPLGCGVDIERGNEAVLWLAMELVYIDSNNAQIRRYDYKKKRYVN